MPKLYMTSEQAELAKRLIVLEIVRTNMTMAMAERINSMSGWKIDLGMDGKPDFRTVSVDWKVLQAKLEEYVPLKKD